jgi:hypothetical protein
MTMGPFDDGIYISAFSLLHVVGQSRPPRPLASASDAILSSHSRSLSAATSTVAALANKSRSSRRGAQFAVKVGNQPFSPLQYPTSESASSGKANDTSGIRSSA